MWKRHPWTVMRASEILKWVETGAYQKIIDKDPNQSPSCFKCGQVLKGTENSAEAVEKKSCKDICIYYNECQNC